MLPQRRPLVRRFLLGAVTISTAHGDLKSRRKRELLFSLLPFLAPVSLRGQKTTIGCSDRLGLAGPGHIRASSGYGADSDHLKTLADIDSAVRVLSDYAYPSWLESLRTVSLHEPQPYRLMLYIELLGVPHHG